MSMIDHSACAPDEGCPLHCRAGQPRDLSREDDLSGISTHYECPPIPTRDYDWSAVRDGYEGGDLIGRGRTEDAAIRDLLDLEEDNA